MNFTYTRHFRAMPDFMDTLPVCVPDYDSTFLIVGAHHAQTISPHDQALIDLRAGEAIYFWHIAFALHKVNQRIGAYQVRNGSEDIIKRLRVLLDRWKNALNLDYGLDPACLSFDFVIVGNFFDRTIIFGW